MLSLTRKKAISALIINNSGLPNSTNTMKFSMFAIAATALAAGVEGFAGTQGSFAVRNVSEHRFENSSMGNAWMGIVLSRHIGIGHC